jgi:hypothetical protein
MDAAHSRPMLSREASFSRFDPARGRGTGVFASQWKTAIGYNPQIIILNQWNGWTHTDQLSPEDSNDLDQLGWAPMIAVQQAVAAWKGATLPSINCD